MPFCYTEAAFVTTVARAPMTIATPRHANRRTETPSLVVRTDADGLSALEPEWRALAESDERATIYQTWEWNEAWWRCFGRGKLLHLLEMRDGGTLVGVAPLYISRHLGTPIRRAAFLGTGVSDYLDLICAPGAGQATAQAALAYLQREAPADAADLQQLAPHAHCLEHAAGLQSLPQEPCPYVPLPTTVKEWLSSLGKKMRENLRYSERLLHRSFTTVEFALADSDNLHECMEQLFTLHQKRWRARSLPGVLGGARVRAFHHLVARRFLDRGWLRLHILRLDGHTVSALYCFRYGPRTYYYLGGFDPTLARYSLGTLLTARAIQHAIEEGCAEFDFLRGNEPYKARWTSLCRTNSRALVARPGSMKSAAFLRLTRLERHIEHRAKQFAEHRGRRP